MTTYKAVFNNKNTGVFSISLVEDPAMEGLFVAFSKEQVLQLKEIDKEQRLLMGLVLEPDKPIYRNQDGVEFNIVFEADTIKELSHSFFKNGYQRNSTIEHEAPISGVSFVESWTVENPSIDKSTNFGFSYPKGSWLAMMKVDSDEVWESYVKTGKVKGFSVDAMVDLEEVNLKSEISMKAEIVEAIKNGFEAVFSKKTETPIELGSVVSGEITIEFEGEALVVGEPVWVMAEDGTKVPLPVGDYPLEGDRMLSVTDEGLVGEIKEAAMPDEAPAESELESSQLEEITNAIKSIMIKYKSEIDESLVELRNEFENVKKENETLKLEVVELSNAPAAKPVSQPTQAIALNKKGRILAKLRNN